MVLGGATLGGLLLWENRGNQGGRKEQRWEGDGATDKTHIRVVYTLTGVMVFTNTVRLVYSASLSHPHICLSLSQWTARGHLGHHGRRAAADVVEAPSVAPGRARTRRPSTAARRARGWPCRRQTALTCAQVSLLSALDIVLMSS